MDNWQGKVCVVTGAGSGNWLARHAAGSMEKKKQEGYF